MNNQVVKKFDTIESDTRAGQFYDIMLCEVEINGVKTPYLSCNCKAWTTGRWNESKALHERSCKHCDKIMLRNISRWNEVLKEYQFESLGNIVAPAKPLPSNKLGLKVRIR